MEPAGKLTIDDMIRIDGFDSGAGDHTAESWLSFTQFVYDNLGLTPDSSILEVGCGCGAFLYPAYQSGTEVTGIDYSEQLVKCAQHMMPDGLFIQSEANNLPFSNSQFDSVCCHSVFQYFTSDDYAEKVIHEMIRTASDRHASIGILDVNDDDKQDLFYDIRGENIGIDTYKEKYRDFPHRFYRKEWFVPILEGFGFDVTIVDQDIHGYANSAFRFNVFAHRDRAS